MTVPAASESLIGQDVGNFVIVSKLGRGAMGEVFLAEQRVIKTKAAIKVLLPHISALEDQVERFFNEALAVGRIAHPGTVKIFDTGMLPSGRAYLTMEFLEGETLASRIARARRLPIDQIADIGQQLCTVLAAIHGAGIVHRDLKPENIFIVVDRELASGERVKVLDFGLAKLNTSQLTATGSMMGTPVYMAPEQWRNARDIDWRADAYSLGCFIYEMATGRRPFNATSLAELCAQHINDKPISPRSLVPEIPRSLDALLQALLEKEPGQRPSSMSEIGAVFDELATRMPAASGKRPLELPLFTAAQLPPLQSASSPAGDIGFQRTLTAGVPPEAPAANHVAPTQARSPTLMRSLVIAVVIAALLVVVLLLSVC